MVLLDTHVWIWTLEGDTHRIGRRSRALLEKARAADAVRVSPISVFEVSALHASGHLHLTRPLGQWLSAAIEEAGIRLAPLSREAAVEAGRLSCDAIPDPLDRLIVATAREANVALVTADRRILDYADSAGSPAVHDARR